MTNNLMSHIDHRSIGCSQRAFVEAKFKEWSLNKHYGATLIVSCQSG